MGLLGFVRILQNSGILQNINSVDKMFCHLLQTLADITIVLKNYLRFILLFVVFDWCDKHDRPTAIHISVFTKT